MGLLLYLFYHKQYIMMKILLVLKAIALIGLIGNVLPIIRNPKRTVSVNQESKMNLTGWGCLAFYALIELIILIITAF